MDFLHEFRQRQLLLVSAPRLQSLVSAQHLAIGEVPKAQQPRPAAGGIPQDQTTIQVELGRLPIGPERKGSPAGRDDGFTDLATAVDEDAV